MNIWKRWEWETHLFNCQATISEEEIYSLHEKSQEKKEKVTSFSLTLPLLSLSIPDTEDSMLEKVLNLEAPALMQMHREWPIILMEDITDLLFLFKIGTALGNFILHDFHSCFFFSPQLGLPLKSYHIF